MTINDLVDVIEKAVGVNLERAYDRTKPQGGDGHSLKLLPPSGRGATRTTRRSWTSWAPPTALRDGMEVTAEWIEQQMRARREAETASRFAVAH